MASNVNHLIDSINKSLQWLKTYRADQYEQRFIQLVEQRRRLRQVASAEKENPAVAAYGVSQVGKSYLMSNMLQQEVIDADGNKSIKPFEVEANGVRYNFINDMNPISKGTEATGVVTRFSSFQKAPERYSDKYPVLMKCLSVTDLTLIICDSYFNDLSNSQTYGRSELDERANFLYQKYKNQPQQAGAPIIADDILDLKSYFARHFAKAGQEFNHSVLFDKLALVAEQIPVDDYAEVLSILWKDEPHLTSFFQRLLRILSKLYYKSDIYLPIDAVLHEQIKENTILSVDCLNGLANDSFPYQSEAFMRLSDGSFKSLGTFPKSELSAVCAEVVYRIDEEFLNGSGRYDTTYIADSVKNRLKKEVTYDILKDTDLLDFPGARSRLQLTTASLEDKLEVIHIMLRGKVAFLFNKYCEARTINILLFCHHSEKNEVTNLWMLLNEWVNNYVGSTPEERARTLQLAGNISPLFNIATKFNMDMAEDQNALANERIAIDERWHGRYFKVLYNEVFSADNVDWVKNWTRTGEFFKNSFLLRDFKYSGTKGSKLYDGFEATGKETVALISDEYRQRLRDSFCESEYTDLLFTDREKVWDVAATMNNDGSLYIIEQLTIVAKAMNNVREHQFHEILQRSVSKIYEIMKEYHVSTDATEILEKNINRANAIFREVEFACEESPDFFGRLLSALQLTEAASFQRLLDLIPRLTDIVSGDNLIQDYELIRRRCNNFEQCTDDDASHAKKWQVFMDAYHFSTRKDAEDYLVKRGVDPAKLFKGDSIRRTNSSVITADMLAFWKDNITSPRVSNEFSGQEGSQVKNKKMDSSVLSNLINFIIENVEAMKLPQRIEEEIKDYVDVLDVHHINPYLVADMVATKICQFVMDFGYSYLLPEQLETAHHVADEAHLDCFSHCSVERKEQYDEEEMTGLLNDILNSARLYTPAYETNYNEWLDYMYIASIANVQVPKYNKQANDELQAILDTIK